VLVTADAVEARGEIMAKFTDTQLIVLSAAGARGDGMAVVPAKMNGAAASKVGASLVTRKLMRELRSKPGMPVWRKGEDDRPISLMITRVGRDAIGVKENAPGEALRPFNAQSEEKGARTLEKPSQERFGDKDSTDGDATSPRLRVRVFRMRKCSRLNQPADPLTARRILSPIRLAIGGTARTVTISSLPRFGRKMKVLTGHRIPRFGQTNESIYGRNAIFGALELGAVGS
jgi:hypothetical protein